MLAEVAVLEMVFRNQNQWLCYNLENIGDIQGRVGDHYHGGSSGARGVHDLGQFQIFHFKKSPNFITFLFSSNPGSEGARTEPVWADLYHHKIFSLNIFRILPQLADNITKGDSEQYTDDDSRS